MKNANGKTNTLLFIHFSTYLIKEKKFKEKMYLSIKSNVQSTLS